jgi:molybdate transport system substrate-binding protein
MVFRWVLLWLLALPVQADTLTVAVAANFASTLDALRASFEEKSEHTVRVVLGGTGVLATQIMRNAPFDVFLAADETRPQMLIEHGYAEASTSFVYAIGQLAFWTPGRTDRQPLGYWLAMGGRPIALANPTLAPYGAAAKTVISSELARLESDFLSLQRSGQLVLADNVAGAFSMAASGNAVAAFIALSQCLSEGLDESEYRIVDTQPNIVINQRAVMTRRGLSNPAAVEFMKFLRAPETRELIKRAGYQLPPVSKLSHG